MTSISWVELTDSERHVLGALSRAAVPKDLLGLFQMSRVVGQRMGPESREIVARAVRVLAGHGLVVVDAPKGGPTAVVTTKGQKVWRGERAESCPMPGTAQGLPFLEGVA